MGRSQVDKSAAGFSTRVGISIGFLIGVLVRSLTGDIAVIITMLIVFIVASFLFLLKDVWGESNREEADKILEDM